MRNTRTIGISILIAAMVLMVGYGLSCKKSSSSKSSTTAGSSPAPSAGAYGVAVDPYIVGAQFFEDANNNGVKDTGEQVSTLSDNSGNFTFPNALTISSTILLDSVVTPTHNGVDYKGEIKRTVDATGTIVVSPLTTLLANGWTEAQVISVLNNAGLTGVTTANLKEDPMAGIADLTSATLTEAHLKKIRASICIYSFLSIMDGVITASNGFDITYDVFVASPTAIALVTQMVNLVNDGLSSTMVTTLSGIIDGINAGLPGGVPPLPSITAGDVIRGSVAISNYVIWKVINVDLAYAPTIVDYTAWANELGRNFYIIRNKTHPTVITGVNQGYIPGAITNILTFSSLKLDTTTGFVEGVP